MPRKSKKPVRKQTHSPTGKVVGQVGQILLPMIAGIAATKADLTEWVYEQGLTALHLLLREDAEEIAGLKGKHEKERTHNHCGSTNGELSFGGRRIQVSRPRVRSKSGEEASLPHFEAFREEDPLPERVLNQILVGVSTRNYESSLDKPAAKLKSRGTSKSAASRHLVSQTTKMTLPGFCGHQPRRDNAPGGVHGRTTTQEVHGGVQEGSGPAVQGGASAASARSLRNWT